MRIIKVFKRKDGTRVEVNASIYSASGDKAGYSFFVRVCEKGKRKFLQAPKDFNADAEINNALNELWLAIKPPVHITPSF